MQPWYDDDLGEGRIFTDLLDHLDEILLWGPLRGCLPESSKNILVVSALNVAQVQHFFHNRGLTIVFESPYLGGYISDAGHQSVWLGEKVRESAYEITTVARVAPKHPQDVYAGLKNDLQQEWDFLQYDT